MLENLWHKKEKPYQGIGGYGGGIGALVMTSAPGALTGPGGMVATGGITQDYSPSPTVHYRSHTFYSPGTFEVSFLSNLPGTYPDAVDLLVIGGGGGGGSRFGGGGGGGAFQTHSETLSSTGNYTMTVGAGGAGGYGSEAWPGNDGTIGGTTTAGIGPVVSPGGGYGGGGDNRPGGDSPGGSGGGGAGRQSTSAGSSGSYGNDGAGSNGTPLGGDNYRGSGGGGAGGTGYDGGPSTPTVNRGRGGAGSTNDYQTGVSQTYAGGGGGGVGALGSPSTPGVGMGGGGRGSWKEDAQPGINGTGGGGGGGGYTTGINPGFTGPKNFKSGTGGDGVIVVRYRINPANQPGNLCKATGGEISFIGTKTVHTFYGNSADSANDQFTVNPGSPLSSVDVFICGCGGSGGVAGGAGGGGGGGSVQYRTGHPVSAGSSYAIGLGTGSGRTINGPGAYRPAWEQTGGGCSFDGITAAGGGGGSGGSQNGYNGGCGGGGNAGYATTKGTGSGDAYPGSWPGSNSPPNGWGGDGGNGVDQSGGGGGGGAGGDADPGGNAPGGGGGDGGAGILYPLTGLVYGAGGGGGGGNPPSYPSPTGYGPGAGGSTPSPGQGGTGSGGHPGPKATDGVAFLGGGGGGGSAAGGPPYNNGPTTYGVSASGNGGFGVIIVSYPT
jgi:hypothetical protein